MTAGRKTVLVIGESGTGKELLARLLHRESANPEAPFIAVNVAAIPRELAESTLFGHEKGSFTGALQQRIGKFGLANGRRLPRGPVCHSSFTSVSWIAPRRTPACSIARWSRSSGPGTRPRAERLERHADRALPGRTAEHVEVQDGAARNPRARPEDQEITTPSSSSGEPRLSAA